MRRLFFVACLLISAGCQTTGLDCAWSDRELTGADALAGREAARTLERCWGGKVRDAQAEHRMESVTARLVAACGRSDMSFRCRLLDCHEINAFSVPGGYIYITQGLYDRLDDASLAAVLAHELAHLVRRDGFKPSCRTCREKLQRELAADRLGTRILIRAGYTAGAMVSALRIVGPAMRDGWGERRVDAVLAAYGEPEDRPSRSRDAATARADSRESADEHTLLSVMP